MPKKRLLYHYHCLIVNRLGSSILIITTLAFIFLLIGIYQGFMDTTLLRLLELVIRLGIISMIIYIYGLGITMVLIIQNHHKKTLALFWKNVIGTLSCFVLVFGALIYNSFL